MTNTVLFTETPLAGARLVDIDPHEDQRGFFARTFCQQEFAAQSLNSKIVQTNLSFNKHKGTLRGMHYQVAPHTECKYVRCIRGAILDVIVDLREQSPTYLEHFSVTLNSENRRALFVPENFAHGFQTLEPDTEVMYMVSGFYTPECERGLLYRDPALSIDWPLPVMHISEKDEQWPLMTKQR